ncbi:DNA polymerase I [Butyrivibrio fibrisolvens DSM 3071]|uniref:DNA polymerase I n=1 Tax=Butyrivibrio fibrisolvens DSM 3071 TaxID=1121131 RepID=A0A1M5SWL2_BUTFI|nr:DNA polymerase I [Butyrivibrio fibrisolvens]SHH42638.1 DNA polymerase I [Butyrivibrio fibrisolvens DSM 3071]
MTQKLLLVDGHSILNRAFYGMPDLTNAEGLHTNAVIGFLNIFFKLLDDENPDYVVVAFDTSAPTFRHDIFKEYKGTRKPMPQELHEQVPLLKEVLDSMGVRRYEQPGLEADDILGTLAKRAEAQGMIVTLVSGDRDLLQIASDNILIANPKTKGGQTTVERYHTQEVIDEWGVTPEKFVELKALMGDSSDNIPGVPKVGPKTAKELMQTYGSIAGIYEHVEEITKNAIRESLKANKESCDLSYTLALIKTDADFELPWDSAKRVNYLNENAYKEYKRLGFKRLLSKFSEEVVNNAFASLETAFTGGSSKNSGFGNGSANNNGTDVANSSNDGFSAGSGFGISEGSSAKGGSSDMNCDLEIENILRNVPQKVDVTSVTSFDEAQKIIQEAKDYAKGHDDRFIGFSVIEDSKDAEDFIGLGISFENGKAYFLRNTEKFTAEYAGKVLEDLSKDCRLATFDIKNTYHLFTPYEIDSKKAKGNFDILIGAYLLNPLKDDYTPEDIAGEHLGRMMKSYKERFGKRSLKELIEVPMQMTLDLGIPMPEEDTKKKSKKAAAPEILPEDALKQIVEYAGEVANTAMHGAFILEKKLEDAKMAGLMQEVEMPLSYVLYSMEKEGIICRRDALKDYGDKLAGRIAELEQNIYKEAGEEFNINSPKQLGVILFEKLGYEGGKKTKTGYSTSADVLEKLAPEHPFVRDILEYRGLAKLKSTYADGLADYIESDNRIHTVFNQTITATGRISSSEPNLQNIPMRTELGRAIRKVFVPRDGYVFADADYSQVELRILADMCADEGLLEDYRSGKDIHRATASKVFHTPFDEVTDTQRRNAKAVNFGIVYGISVFGLANDLGISREEAKGYMEGYFLTYPGVKAYQEGAVAFAKEHGYSITTFGRRRPIPELKESNFMRRQFGERVAMNAPIQGTAADIMKIAMIRVFMRLRKENLKSRLILQIHDELLIETAPDEVEVVKNLLTEEMQKAADLKVPLIAECSIGKDWFEAK